MKNHIVIDSTNYNSLGYFEPYIRYCAYDYYNEQWMLKKRKISDYELLYISAGEGDFTIEDRSYHVNKNDILLLKPGLQHEGTSTHNPFSFFCIHFDIYVSKSVNAISCKEDIFTEPVPLRPVKYYKTDIVLPDYIVLPESSNINGIFAKLINENRKAEKGYKLLTKAYFTELFLSLFRQNRDICLQKEYNEEITSIINFIKQNYSNKIYLSDISDYVHLSPSYISSLFKRQTGVTVSEYITIFRIATAKKLLLEKYGKISEIAYNTGFYDVHHFTRAFKKYEGLTPGEYKKINYS